MKNKIYLYLYNNEIIIYCNNNILSTKSKSIENSSIKNILLFKYDLSNIFKSNKINYSIFSNDIVYINILNTYLEKEIIKNILNEFSFRNIYIENLSKYLDNKTYILNNKNKIYFIKEKILIECLDINTQINMLLDNKKIKEDIYVLKYNNKEILDKIKESKASIYYIYNPQDTIINKLIKNATNM